MQKRNVGQFLQRNYFFYSLNFTAENAGNIRQPILYVGRENSAHYFQEIYKLILSWFPHAETKILLNTTHMLHGTIIGIIGI